MKTSIRNQIEAFETVVARGPEALGKFLVLRKASEAEFMHERLSAGIRTLRAVEANRDGFAALVRASSARDGSK